MAIDPNILLNEGRCLSCNSNASEAQLLELAFLQRIDASGGGGGGTPDLPLNSVQFNEAGAFGGSADLTFDDATNVLALTGSMTASGNIQANSVDIFTSGSLVASAPALEITQTWNNGAVTFTAIDVNATTTAAAAASMLLNLRAGGSSRMSVRSDGRITNSVACQFAGAGVNEVGVSFYQSGVQVSSSALFSFGSGAAASSPDTALSRNAAGIVEINNNTPGTFRDLYARIVRTSPGFTVATLPVAGTIGRRTYVTDAAAPVYGAAVAGGGAVVTSCMDNGTIWIVT